MLVLFSYTDQRWKIADFGITSEVSGNELRSTESRRGTNVYRSPEILVGGVYNTKTDIWALGCIVFEFCTKRTAFSGDHETIDYKYSGARSRKSVFESSFLWPTNKEAINAREILTRFVDQTLLLEWEDRPTCSDLVQFLRNLDRECNLSTRPHLVYK